MPTDDPILWLLLLIPGSWVLCIVILIRDEWRAHKSYRRESRYR